MLIFKNTAVDKRGQPIESKTAARRASPSLFFPVQLIL
jgi:hypothetical protein